MILLKIVAGLIFIIFGVLVFSKGIRTTRIKGFRESFIEIIAGVGFVIIGFLIWLGYFG